MRLCTLLKKKNDTISYVLYLKKMAFVCLFANPLPIHPLFFFCLPFEVIVR